MKHFRDLEHGERTGIWSLYMVVVKLTGVLEHERVDGELGHDGDSSADACGYRFMIPGNKNIRKIATIQYTILLANYTRIPIREKSGVGVTNMCEAQKIIKVSYRKQTSQKENHFKVQILVHVFYVWISLCGNILAYHFVSIYSRGLEV